MRKSNGNDDNIVPLHSDHGTEAGEQTAGEQTAGGRTQTGDDAATAAKSKTKSNGTDAEANAAKKGKTWEQLLRGEIAELNDRYAVVLQGSKVRVLTFTQRHNGDREMINYLSFQDFRNLYMNQFIIVGQDTDGNNIKEPLGKVWLSHPERRQYLAVTFEPCQKAVIDGKLNLWRGWGVEPVEGDWSLMQKHIFEVLASGNSKHEQYILNYAAWCLQHPGEQAEVALVFKGPEGTGRGIFARALCKCFGQHAHQISSIKHLTGDFNNHLIDCCLLYADEAFWPGYRNQEGALKRLITEPTLFIEPKGIDAFEVRNVLHLIMVSNSEWVIPASMDARRFAMFEVAEHKKQDATWFKPLYQQMENGGYAAMLHDLLTRDLGDWHPRQIIKTEALREQQHLSLDSLAPMDAWWFTLLSDGVLPGQQQLAEDYNEETGKKVFMYGEDSNPRRAFSKDLFERARACVPQLKFVSDIQLAKALKTRGCRPFSYGRRGWEFPPLREARDEWVEKKMPGHEWGDELEDWQEREDHEQN